MKKSCPCYLFLSAIAAIALLSVLSEYEVISFDLLSAAYLISFICAAGIVLLFYADYAIAFSAEPRSSRQHRTRSEKASLPSHRATTSAPALHHFPSHPTLTAH